MKQPHRILIVDDHAMVRLGLAEAIEATADFTLVAEAADAAQALALFRKHRPDVVIMDFQLPGGDGAQATAAICQEFPEARVLLFSVHEGEEDIWRAAEAGARCYLPKSTDTPGILTALRRVAAGETFFPEAIAAKLAARRERGHLTPRETQVLALVVKGYSNKEIVTALHMSEATVKLHISNLLAKLHVADRTQAAIEAIRRGIIHLE